MLVLMIAVYISIHASAKEATGNVFNNKEDIRFQSTPPRRRRRWIGGNPARTLTFQSTPPRRRRRLNLTTKRLIFDFNPRLREGGDSSDDFFSSNCKNFNPRLREGGDEYFLPPFPFLCFISIHASAKEATFMGKKWRQLKYISIHASAKEATVKHELGRRTEENFNPRLREGGDSVRPFSPLPVSISIHASAKEATM